MLKIKISNAILGMFTRLQIAGVYFTAALTFKDARWLAEKKKIIEFQSEALELVANPRPNMQAILKDASLFEWVFEIENGTSTFTRNYKLLHAGKNPVNVDYAVIMMPLFTDKPITHGLLLDLFLEVQGIPLTRFSQKIAYDWGEYATWRDSSIESDVKSPFWIKR